MSNNVVVQIPCLNEESTIGDVVRDFKQKLPRSRVIVYDNNSTDNSILLAKKNGAEVVKMHMKSLVKKNYQMSKKKKLMIRVKYTMKKLKKIVKIKK